MKKLVSLKIFLLALSCLLVLWLVQACMVQRIDHTPFRQSDYYRHTLQELKKSPPLITEAGKLQVGWAKVNITPPVGTPMAGYGKRKGLRYQEVHDSVWVRSFAFDNGEAEAIVVTLDMLLAPMTIAAALEKEYPALGLKPEQVYLTATHTHTSFGGWGQKLAGWLLAGSQDEDLVKETTARIVESIRKAQQNKQPARVGHGIAYAPELVRNRLTGLESGRDTTLRFLKIEQASGETAVLATFSAHPTLLPPMEPVLSRDYPGVLVDHLEQTVDFAAFAAGAVGSQAVEAPYGDTFESTEIVGRQLAEAIKSELAVMHLNDTATIGFARIPLDLPDPEWRLTTKHSLAPFLFHGLFGSYPAYITSLQLGRTVLLGVPADYSGELLPVLEKQASDQGQQVIVTSFNGGYIGYITPDKYYPLKKYETRDMNFYGPQSGGFLTDILLRLLQKHRY